MRSPFRRRSDLVGDLSTEDAECVAVSAENTPARVERDVAGRAAPFEGLHRDDRLILNCPTAATSGRWAPDDVKAPQAVRCDQARSTRLAELRENGLRIR